MDNLSGDHEEDVEKSAEKAFEQARILVKEGKYPEALESYLYAFDNRDKVYGWGGVGLSYIPSEIAKLGEKYPPAKEALLQRRDAYEAKIREGNDSHAVLSSWIALNHYLKDSAREMQLLKEFGASNKLSMEFKQKIIDSNYLLLLKDKKYQEIGEFFNHFGWMLWLSIGAYEADCLFPRRPRDEFAEMDRRRILMQGTNLFEVALGTERYEIAETIRRRVGQSCSGPFCTVRFILSALRAGKAGIAREIFVEASASLSGNLRKRLARILGVEIP